MYYSSFKSFFNIHIIRNILWRLNHEINHSAVTELELDLKIDEPNAESSGS